MSQNPYEAPGTSPHVVRVGTPSVDVLRSLAKAQRGLNLSILAYLVVVPFSLAMAAVASHHPVLKFLTVIPILAIVAVVIGAFYFTIRVTRQMMHPIVSVLVTLLTCVPCVGLAVLVSIDQQAMRVLKRNGVRIGTFGADMSQFDRTSTPQQQPGQGENPFG